MTEVVIPPPSSARVIALEKGKVAWCGHCAHSSHSLSHGYIALVIVEVLPHHPGGHVWLLVHFRVEMMAGSRDMYLLEL